MGELKGKGKDGSERWEALYYPADFRRSRVSLAEDENGSLEDFATVDGVKGSLRAIRDAW